MFGTSPFTARSPRTPIWDREAAAPAKPEKPAKRVKVAKAADPKAWIKETTWYKREVAKDAAAERAKFARAPRARSEEANEQVGKYAAWLMERDGVDLAALQAQAAVTLAPVALAKVRKGSPEFDTNASLRRTIASAPITRRVEWELTEHGYRPRCIHFHAFRGSYPRDLIHTVHIPHWNVAWEAVTVEEEPALDLAA